MSRGEPFVPVPAGDCRGCTKCLTAAAVGTAL